MQLALVPITPYVLLGFAAVTCRGSRARNGARSVVESSSIAIGGAAPVRAVCRLDLDLDLDLDAKVQIARSATPTPGKPTGVAVLRLDVAPAGDIRNAEVVTTSGFSALDTAALSLVRTARMELPTAGKYRAIIVFTE